MKSVASLFGAGTAALLVLSSAAFAHEDDPKAKSWEPPFIGPIWRLADQGGADGGVAESFAADGVQLLGWFPVTTFDASNSSGNDCWGYVSPSGREYAIIGLSNGTGIVEITNPEAADIVTFLPGPQSLWRNVKVYKHWLYAVSEGGGGIQVFDLDQIDAGIVTTLPSVSTGGASATHTMIINEQTGYLYRMGGGGNGLRIYNLEPNPGTPVYVGAWSDRYVHDGMVVNYTSGPYAGKEVFLACGGLNNGYTQTGLSIIDVTNKASLQVMSTFYYPNAFYCHQIWTTPDLKYGYINDELDESNAGIYSLGRIVDLTNLSAPVLAGTYDTGLGTVDHNEYVRGDKLFCSNYKSGIRIFDLTNKTAPAQVGWFDTYPADDSAGYAGLWSNYPFFPSGTIIGSDIQRGLFIWRLSDSTLSFAYPEGLPTFINPAGESIQVEITPSEGATVAAGSAKLQIETSSGTIETEMASLGGNLWLAQTPPIACGENVGLRFVASVEGGGDTGLFADPVAPTLYTAVVTYGEAVGWTDDMELSLGWTAGAAGDTATTGQWVRVNPNGTAAQPEDDHTSAPGVNAWVTGQGSVGGALGEADVDNGITTLTSPTFNALTVSDPYVTYWRWYSNNMGSNPYTNSMLVQISNNNGQSWTLLEDVSENFGAWIEKKWHIADHIFPTSSMKIRFVARDLTNAVVEAGVDDVRISSLICIPPNPGDVNGDGVVNGADITFILGQWGTSGPGDLDGSGTVDGGDITIVLGNWS